MKFTYEYSYNNYNNLFSYLPRETSITAYKRRLKQGCIFLLDFTIHVTT